MKKAWQLLMRPRRRRSAVASSFQRRSGTSPGPGSTVAEGVKAVAAAGVRPGGRVRARQSRRGTVDPLETGGSDPCSSSPGLSDRAAPPAPALPGPPGPTPPTPGEPDMSEPTTTGTGCGCGGWSARRSGLVPPSSSGRRSAGWYGPGWCLGAGRGSQHTRGYGRSACVRQARQRPRAAGGACCPSGVEPRLRLRRTGGVTAAGAAAAAPATEPKAARMEVWYGAEQVPAFLRAPGGVATW